MLIKEEALKHWIDNFFGYGSWNARFWFVAHEEGGGDLPQEVADKLNYFYKNHPAGVPTSLCDIRELYRQVGFTIDGPRANLFSNLNDYRFGKDAVQHGTWKNLIAFAHGYLNKKVPDLLAYQRKTLALASKENEALLRLYPLPAHNHAWYYSWLDLPKFDFLKYRETYQNHIYPNRIQGILNNMKAHKPEVVVMYGMSNINRIKKSVQAFYPEAKFSMIKAIPRQIPQHHRANLPGTTLLITTQIPALKHNRIETGFDWETLGKSLRPH